MLIDRFKNYILPLFLFQYSLLIPFMNWAPGSRLVAASGIFIMSLGLVAYGRQKINPILVSFYCIVMASICLKCLLGLDYTVIGYVIAYATPPMFICLCCTANDDEWLNALINLALINFVILVANPFLPGYGYMRFGYGMILTSIVCLQAIMLGMSDYSRLKRIAIVVAFIISTLECLVYGSRGSLIVLAFVAVLNIFLIDATDKFKKFGLLALITSFIILLPSIISILRDVANRFGVNSYALMKLQRMLDQGLVASASGRDVLYNNALGKILDSPIYGNNITLDTSNETYVHNIFLQVTQDFGLLGLIVFIVLTISILYAIYDKNNNINDRIMLTILFAVAYGRLMFSSYYLMRPEYWLLIAFFLRIVYLRSSFENRGSSKTPSSENVYIEANTRTDNRFNDHVYLQ